MDPGRIAGRRATCFLLLAGMCAAGCRPDGRVTVEGTVRYRDGAPVARGVVRFEGQTRSGHAAIRPDGRYVISGGGAGPGLLPGRYAIVVDNTAEPPVWDERRNAYVHGKPLVDPRYASPSTSGLECTVSAPLVFDIVVDRPPE